MKLLREQRRCPAEFQDRLTRMFGRNKFGDPRFIIVWGQAYKHRLGVSYEDRHGNARKGYRNVLQHGGPSWVVMRWKEPFEYGSPDSFFASTYNWSLGLCALGQYPYRGRYEIMLPLMAKEYKNGELAVDHFPLSHAMIDRVIPFVLAYQMLSEEEKRASRDLANAIEERKKNEEIADRMTEYLPAWYGAVSYGGQGCRTSLLDRKMDAIQKVWDRMSRRGRPRFATGVRSGDHPAIVGRG